MGLLTGPGEPLGPDRSPVALTIATALSPLSFDHQALGSLIDFARKGLPAIAQTNAEAWAGVVLSQLIQPGWQYLTAPHMVKNHGQSLYEPRFSSRGPLEGPNSLTAERERLARKNKNSATTARRRTFPPTFKEI